MSRISIITINYNDVIGLERTILSVINQKNILFEYIVIDGNSSDGGKEVIKKYDDNITYSVSEEDSGIYNAMNKGIAKATGDYLLFMNSGDVLIDDVNILATCNDMLIEDIVAFDCYLEKDDEIVGRKTHAVKPTLFYVYKNGLKHQSTFIKRSLFTKLGDYNEAYKIASDYEFWIRCFLDPKTTSKSYSIPVAKFKLNGISQSGDWNSEHVLIEEEWLGNTIEDFNLLEELLPYKKSRILSSIVKLIRFLKF